MQCERQISDSMIGEIDSNKDSLEILTPLVKKLETNYKLMSIGALGNISMSLVNEKIN